jgi:hypothetical protein
MKKDRVIVRVKPVTGKTLMKTGQWKSGYYLALQLGKRSELVGFGITDAETAEHLSKYFGEMAYHLREKFKIEGSVVPEPKALPEIALPDATKIEQACGTAVCGDIDKVIDEVAEEISQKIVDKLLPDDEPLQAVHQNVDPAEGLL